MALKKLDWWDRYAVADESADIRGWTLFDAMGVETGKIEDLVFEEETRRVRYAAAALDGRKVLVPIGLIALDEANKRASVQGLTQAKLARLCAYDEDKLDELGECNHYRDYVPDAGNERPDYAAPHFQGGPTQRLVWEREIRSTAGKELSFSGTEPSAEELARRDANSDDRFYF